MVKSLARLLIAFTTSTIFGTSVFSADLSLKASPIAVALPSWTGIYLGVQGGGAYSDVNSYLPTSATNLAIGCIGLALCPSNFGSHTATGGLAGGQAGINYQSGMWLVGGELEAAWVGLTGGALSVIPFLAQAGLTGNSKIDGVFDATARVGVVAGRSLFFVKGGVAFARATYWTATPVQTTTTAADTRMGWIAGVGAEYEIHGPWTAKIEYDYIDFGRKRESLFGVGGPVDLDIKQSIQIVKAGVNYRFTGW